jgi:hypothetical protein
MSATISSPVVQPAFGLGNPNIGSVVSIQRPAVRPAATEDVKMFADKGFVSHLGRTAMIAGVAATVLTSVGPSAAVAAPATKEKGLMAAGTSEPPTSAPSAATIAAAIIAAVAQRLLPRLQALLAPGSRSRPPMPAATPTMIPTAITAARARHLLLWWRPLLRRLRVRSALLSGSSARRLVTKTAKNAPPAASGRREISLLMPHVNPFGSALD